MELKEKLLAELKTKYAGQLTSKFIEQLTDRLILKVEKDEDIQGVIDELDNAPVKIQDLQSEGDRRAKELSNKIKELEAQLTKKIEPAPPSTPDDKYNELLERMKNFEGYMTNQAREKEAAKAHDLLLKRLESKQIPRVLVEDAAPQSEDEVDGIILKAEARFEQLKKDIGVVKGEDPPRRGDQAAEQRKVIDDIKRITKKMK